MKESKYELWCSIVPKPGKLFYFDKVIIKVIIYDNNGNQYGNGKGLLLQVNGGYKQIFDIRYDNRYSEDNEIDYIMEFVKEYAHNYAGFNIDEILSIQAL